MHFVLHTVYIDIRNTLNIEEVHIILHGVYIILHIRVSWHLVPIPNTGNLPLLLVIIIVGQL